MIGTEGLDTSVGCSFTVAGVALQAGLEGSGCL